MRPSAAETENWKLKSERSPAAERRGGSPSPDGRGLGGEGRSDTGGIEASRCLGAGCIVRKGRL